jgi:hypothetical protein
MREEESLREQSSIESVVKDYVDSFNESEPEAVEETTIESDEQVVVENAKSDEVEDEIRAEESTNKTVEDADVESKPEIEGEVEDLDKELSGFVPEYKDLAKSIEDQELRQKIIDAGKKQRAAIDRKMSELGDQKKQNSVKLEQYEQLEALFAKDAKEAIRTLANGAKVNLNELIDEPTAQKDDSLIDDDDYRTEEEIARDKRLEALEQKVKLREEELERKQRERVQEDAVAFVNAKDENGNLKYPHVARVGAKMGELILNSSMTYEEAYNAAVYSDHELRSQYEADILSKAEAKRKAEVVKAKKLNKIAPKSTSLKAKVSDPYKSTVDAVSQFYG